VESVRTSRAGIAFTQLRTYLAALLVSLALAAWASAQHDVYKNTSTYLNNGVINGDAKDLGSSSFKTLMIADDITVASGGAGLPINSYSFSVRNFSGAAIQARALITVYADNGANAPGDLLYSVTFAPQTYAANAVQLFDFSPGGNLFNVPASGKMWAGMAFDNRAGLLPTTLAELDELGQGAYGPVTLGSSSGNIFVTEPTGSYQYAVSNPAGHLESPDVNLGWRFSSPNELPEPGAITAVCGAAIVLISRRRRADRSA
jgi:hypothetical protein